jgi:MSHA biogenesis protein MshM
MYLEHFGLKELPFSITPDTSFFFASQGSQEALNTLLFAARSGEGFIKITGEVGTGKTLLCRQLIRSLGDEFKVAYILNPHLSPIALLKEVASELEIKLPRGNTGKDEHELIRIITERLISLAGEGKRVVICLDEAQAIPIESLEALRLLTNLETEKRKLLQVIIFGQPELDEKLANPSIRQLRQRITFEYRLPELQDSELAYYLYHRLKVAGFSGSQMFTRPAIWLLNRKTRRYPRLVNILAHKALLSAYGRGRRTVRFWDVMAASDDTESVRTLAKLRRKRFFIPLAAGALAAAVALLVTAYMPAPPQFLSQETAASVVAFKSNNPENDFAPTRAAVLEKTKQWAAAWSAKDFDAYLGFYSEEFKSSDHPTRDAWAEFRKPRVLKDGPIDVQLAEIKIRPAANNQVRVDFEQRYDSATLNVVSPKTLVWAKEGNDWKILREQSR